MPAQTKTIQYLQNALATELALAQTLVSHIAVTPRGRYRDQLERHLEETRGHAEQVGDRLEELGVRGQPWRAAGGVAQALAAPVLAAWKTPIDLLRGSSAEEKLLCNARDEFASEALEIATYTAIEAYAHEHGDTETERLARSILREEERMLEALRTEIPRLVEAVVARERSGRRRIDLGTLGLFDAARMAAATTKDAARRGERKTRSAAQAAAREARKVPGVAVAEGEMRGAVADEGDLPIAGYDTLTAQEIVARLDDLTQRQLATIDAYERRHQARATVLDRIGNLRSDEPWPGYDELTVEEVRAALADADGDRAQDVIRYERRHKNRSGVLNAAERKTVTS